jgi:hypothetical protein
VIDSQDLINRFTYHSPVEDDVKKYELIRGVALSFSMVLNDLVPDGREKVLALTKLEELVFWANAGIARNNAVEKG